MKDQADKLRQMAMNIKSQIEAEISQELKHTRVVVISSGKGGVGKSTLALNLSLMLCTMDKKVILMDADLGMANIDIMLGMFPEYNLYHMIKGQKSLKDIIISGPNNLKLIPGGSGITELANLSEDELKRILVEMGSLDGEFDYMIVDTGAGISTNVISFILAADDVIIVTTPEPTSLTDAYGVIKSMSKRDYEGNVYLVINKVNKESEGIILGERLKLVGEKFLDMDIEVLGHIMQDYPVEQGIKKQEAFIEAFPKSTAAKNIFLIAQKYLEDHSTIKHSAKMHSGGIRGFLKRISQHK